MDDYLEGLSRKLYTDLSVELMEDEEGGCFSEILLRQKIKNAINEVACLRRYPSSYSEEDKLNDLSSFYSVVRRVALYDYNQIGMEFERSHSEKNTDRTFVNRNQLFVGIIPITKIIK